MNQGGMNQGQDRSGEPFSSNAVRLSIREWSIVLVALALIAFLVDGLWPRIEKFEPSVDYRIPYDLSEDYWLFDRYCGVMSEANKTLVFGDSFIWGQYVEKEASLTHFLNQHAGSERFVNAGLDGAHPMALGGLIEHYCGSMRDKDVILHLNLLWLSSPQADLQGERELSFNHPQLVPQFNPRIPSYGESVSGRIGVVLARYIPGFEWVGHLQETYFGSADLARWTLEHPYDNPLRQVTLDLPDSSDKNHADAQPWFVRTQGEQELPWVSLDTSLQWQAFQRLLELLRSRGNRVFVLIGPLNEHMLSPPNAEVYRGMVASAGTWLSDHGFSFFLPSTLPSELYADLSHPLSGGYSILAEEIWGMIGSR
ncbi:MAG: hypothetical protein MUO50_09745 [Longimicrobiales bacterium]|nr:hypothetical protein [Longimicrobiales bacterium]